MTVYTVGIGNFSYPVTESQKKVADIIKEFKGLEAVCPMYPHGTLLLFKTLNDAKEARNIFHFEGVETGTNIIKCDFDYDTKVLSNSEVVA